MTSDGFKIAYRRVFRTKPSIDKANERVGVNFVDILFGLVVTAAVLALADEVVTGWANDAVGADETRIAHLVVAITLTVLSWIGYHMSQQRPPFQIQFVNFPLLQFGLDVAMVVTYYFVVLTAENSRSNNGPSIDPTVRPEAILIAFAFLLYFAWDWLGYRVFRDPAYATANNSKPKTSYTGRRWVTVVFFAISVATATFAWYWNPHRPRTVIAFDAFLFAVLVLYRIAKPAFDRTTWVREDEPEPQPIEA